LQGDGETLFGDDYVLLEQLQALEVVI
jgi:hypothetical protein